MREPPAVSKWEVNRVRSFRSMLVFVRAVSSLPCYSSSLYINGVVSRLREDSCGVECGGDTIPGLLFADDTTLLASYEEGLRKSLDVLVQWCEDWGIRINVAKCGIMHIRKKKMMRN